MSKEINLGTWTVKVLQKGDKYGLNNCLAWEHDEPGVEFHYNPTNQFVSRYYLSTMLEHEDGRGLDLQGDVPAWKMDAEEFATAKRWLREN